MSSSALRTYWSKHGRLSNYRRRVVCIGARAVALAGTTVVDDRALDEETWIRIDAAIEASTLGIRVAAFAAGRRDDEEVPDGVVAFLSPTGTVLAATDDAATAEASDRVKRRARRSFEANGIRYDLCTSTRVRHAEVFELVAVRGAVLSERDATLVEWVRKGLTNREVATMLGVPGSTVKKALERLFARHGASNRVELLRMLEGA